MLTNILRNLGMERGVWAEGAKPEVERNLEGLVFYCGRDFEWEGLTEKQWWRENKELI